MLGFFYDWRTTLVGFIAIPLSIVAAGVVLQFTGASLNSIVLVGFAMAIGIVVYDAIIDVDNVLRRLRGAGLRGGAFSAPRVILEATLESRTSVLFGTLILLLTVVPIYLMGGASGPFFQTLAVSYGLAVLASMIVAWTVTPALCYVLVANASAEHRPSPLVTGFQRSMRPCWRASSWARAAFAVAAVLAAALVMIPSPVVSCRQPQGAQPDPACPVRHLAAGDEPTLRQGTTGLQSIPGVHDVSAHIGRAVLGDQVVDVHWRSCG
jgi:multidrug efflux pump subunit AcrB